MKTTVVQYIQRKKCSPFTMCIDSSNGFPNWAVVDGTDSVVWYPTFSGNSKQRRQKRKAMLKELNQ